MFKTDPKKWIRWTPSEEEALMRAAQHLLHNHPRIPQKTLIDRMQNTLPAERRRTSATAFHHLSNRLGQRLRALWSDSRSQSDRSDMASKRDVDTTLPMMTAQAQSVSAEPSPFSALASSFEASLLAVMTKVFESDTFVEKLAAALAQRLAISREHSQSAGVKTLVHYAPTKQVPKDGRTVKSVAILGLLPDQANIVQKALDSSDPSFMYRLNVNYIEKKRNLEHSGDYRSYDYVIQMVKFTGHAKNNLKSSNLILERGGLTSLTLLLKDIGQGRRKLPTH